MEFSEDTSPRPQVPVFPPMVALLLLVMTALVGSLLGSGLAYAWCTAQGYDLPGLLAGFGADSLRPERDAIRIVNVFSQVCSFLLPAVFTGILLYRRQWITYFKLHTMPGWLIAAAGVGFVLVSFPFVQLTYWLNHALPLPDRFIEMEQAAGQMIKGILVMDNPAELWLNIIVIGLIPALGEELLFRGVVQQQLRKAFANPVLAIWVTAIIFSAIHMQFAGFIPRMVLGATLGYLFYWTNSLWMPVLAHFLTNALQVLAQYASGGKLAQAEITKPEMINWLAAALSLALMLALGHYLWRSRQVKV